jgi:putative transposase
MSLIQKQGLLDPKSLALSIRQQSKILGLNRSSIYYQEAGESPLNLTLMQLLDEEYTLHPFKGVLRMVAYLHELDYEVNEKRVRRLLRKMGILAIYPKKKLSKSNPNHKKYPYLLKDLDITEPNHVWCSDITYIRLKTGFVYLVAIMDWYSRYVLSWRLSNSLDTSFCIEALEDALLSFGQPEIMNTDQGSQYTSESFTGVLLANGITISMDGRGRAFDNIFIERLWRSVKYEEVYIHEYNSAKEAKKRLGEYFDFYNYERHHQGLDNQKPAELYFGKPFPITGNNVTEKHRQNINKVKHKIKLFTGQKQEFIN